MVETVQDSETKRGRGRPPKAELEDTVLVHFLADGVSAFGFIWLAGQEVEVQRDSEEFRSTLDRDGKSWLDQTEAQQKKAWGCARWGKGASPVKNSLLHYKENTDIGGLTKIGGQYYTREWLKFNAEKELARGRSLPKP